MSVTVIDMAGGFEMTLVCNARSPRCETDSAKSEEVLLKLCGEIALETNPTKIAGLISELIEILTDEQNAIKAKINANLSNH